MSLLFAGGVAYAGFVDPTNEIFRLASLDLSDGSLAGIGSAVDISSLVDSGNAMGLSLMRSGDTIYAGIVSSVSNNANDFYLLSLDLSAQFLQV